VFDAAATLVSFEPFSRLASHAPQDGLSAPNGLPHDEQSVCSPSRVGFDDDATIVGSRGLGDRRSVGSCYTQTVADEVERAQINHQAAQ